MLRRYLSIWFPYLITDRMSIRYPELKTLPFVLAAPEKGRMIIKAVNPLAAIQGIHQGMVVADARAIFPELKVLDHPPDLAPNLLRKLAEWCIRYTPLAGIDLPDGLLLDASGCTHLWGGELLYLQDIEAKLMGHGYRVRLAIADTIGAAWAIARYDKVRSIVAPGEQLNALLPLPAAALRLDADRVCRLEKLGLYRIEHFIRMQRSALRRRFGDSILVRMDQALGNRVEVFEPALPEQPYQQWLPCPEPIATAKGIEIALSALLEELTARLKAEEKGVRTAVLKCFRVDGQQQQIGIATGRPSRSVRHLFKLFEIRIAQLEPALGFELFLLEAPVVEALSVTQENFWGDNESSQEAIAQLLDRIAGKIGGHTICRYLPDEHYWPERSVKRAKDFFEMPQARWPDAWPRPLHLLPQPERIEVTVAIPDYPPILFRYQEKVHRIARADGPERIEQEWWIEKGLYRDYYYVEDEEGCRYWLFRAGHYHDHHPEWYLHGYFA